ncbi:hypothetical protein L6452_40999 [Arctium lappa]|uniref:Uncharacterized protein n=1 Tax=Arctium lappa TaxID=4217 RepID=A0ACB8XPC9_ARCLA|nr:hypothetical protein L6452_40999 [Arctium lappa]
MKSSLARWNVQRKEEGSLGSKAGQKSYMEAVLHGAGRKPNLGKEVESVKNERVFVRDSNQIISEDSDVRITEKKDKGKSEENGKVVGLELPSAGEGSILPESGKAGEESVLKSTVEEFPIFNEGEGNEVSSRDSINAEENLVGMENVGPTKEDSNKACESKAQVQGAIGPLECGPDSQIDAKRDVEVASLENKIRSLEVGVFDATLE